MYSGLVDHESKSNKKAEWYCLLLQNHDKEQDKASFGTEDEKVLSDADSDTGDKIAAEKVNFLLYVSLATLFLLTFSVLILRSERRKRLKKAKKMMISIVLVVSKILIPK